MVRNPNISHFIRFNTMQAILLDIILVVFSLILTLLDPSVFGNLIVQHPSAMCCSWECWRRWVIPLCKPSGAWYAEIPTLSEAVHMQVR